MVNGLWFRVYGLGFRVWTVWFRNRNPDSRRDLLTRKRPFLTGIVKRRFLTRTVQRSCRRRATLWVESDGRGRDAAAGGRGLLEVRVSAVRQAGRQAGWLAGWLDGRHSLTHLPGESVSESVSE